MYECLCPTPTASLKFEPSSAEQKDSQQIDVSTQDRLEISSIEIDVFGDDISGQQTKNANILDVAKLKIKRPCGKSDPTSTHIVCTSCHQSWHNK